MGAQAILISLTEPMVGETEGLDDTFKPEGLSFEPFHCNLDKSWRQLQVALTGSDTSGNHPLGIIDGLGCEIDIANEARALTPAEVRTFHASLQDQSDDALKDNANWDWFDLWGVRGPGDSIDRNSAWSHATENLADLREFAEKCVEHECGAVIVIH